MKSVLTVLAIVSVALAGSARSTAARVTTAAQRGKPTTRVEVNIDGEGEPRSIDELLRRSGFIVEGVVETAKDRDIYLSPDNPIPIVATSYLVRITEVFKTSKPGKFPAVISVLLPIGTRDTGNVIEEHVSSRLMPLALNHHYVLFLESGGLGGGNQERDDYSLVTDGDSSVIEINGDRATGRDPHSTAAGLATAGAEHLRNELRTKGRGGSR